MVKRTFLRIPSTTRLPFRMIEELLVTCLQYIYIEFSGEYNL